MLYAMRALRLGLERCVRSARRDYSETYTPPQAWCWRSHRSVFARARPSRSVNAV